MKKNIFKIIYILIMFSFINYLINMKYNNKYISYNTSNLINTEYNKKENKMLYIPKINLNTKLQKYINDTSLDKSVTYYNNLNVNDKIILFGHSGFGYGTFFNRLDELDLGDILYLNIDNDYKYELKRKYNINKNDIYILNEELDSHKLLLITCNKKDKNKRLILEFVKNSP